MYKILVTWILIMIAGKAFASKDEAVVIQVRKKIKLHNLERVYADYFIRGGTKLGLSKGVIVSVVRRVPVHDPFENASIGDFHVKVADVEIIQVDEKKAIGRLVKIDRRSARPMLSYDAIMIGDRLDLDSMRSKVSLHEPPSDVFQGSHLSRRMPASQENPYSSLKKQENNTPELTKP